ncbi:MAG: hypothetical protein DHS20C08_20360 [Rhodomicrobium sp.]|nr:MAG: hypothetical protein DHS20C08_20360 [Rhodomicrobium sp.]
MSDDMTKLSKIIGSVSLDIKAVNEISDELNKLIGELDEGYSAKLVCSFERLHEGLVERVSMLKQKNHILQTIMETKSLEIVDVVIPKRNY